MKLPIYLIPTTRCNFACDYCFEFGLKESDMDKAVIRDAVSFTSELFSRKSFKELDLTLFGGEPLLSELSYEAAWSFRTLSDTLNVQFSLSIITNGYLLDRRNIRRLKKLGLKRAIIALDGNKQLHDKRRPLKGGGNTYDTILENLEMTSKETEIMVRVNYSSGEGFKVLPVFETLIKTGINKIYLAPIRPTIQHCGNLPLEKEDIAELFNLKRKAEKAGLNVRYTSRLGPCMVHHPYAVAISPEGKFYKCLFGVGRDFCYVGNLKDGLLPLKKLVNFEYLKDLCRDCEFLGICYGGCRYDAYITTGSFEGRVCKKEALRVISKMS